MGILTLTNTNLIKCNKQIILTTKTIIITLKNLIITIIQLTRTNPITVEIMIIKTKETILNFTDDNEVLKNELIHDYTKNC